jgi:hypothetical protein
MGQFQSSALSESELVQHFSSSVHVASTCRELHVYTTTSRGDVTCNATELVTRQVVVWNVNRVRG